jgi:nucleotide-binding universal stress UspA family protein
VTSALDLGRRLGVPGGGEEPPEPGTVRLEAVLLASESRAFPKKAVSLAARLAEPGDATVHVLTIARIWGTSLGFPNPGLYPNKQEWDDAREKATDAVEALKSAGRAAEGHVFGVRNATKRIVKEAERLGCGAIVMAADEPRNQFVGNFMWSQEPQRVRRRAGIPVYLVTEP